MLNNTLLINATCPKMSFRDSAPGNITLPITAFLGNIVIIFALKRVSSLHRRSMLLLGCLAITDLLVGLITLAAIGVDRLLALSLGLGYRHVVTLRRLQSCVFISILSTMTYSYRARITLSIICTATFSYTNIYLTLRNHQAQVH